jgi:hypothetical protein
MTSAPQSPSSRAERAATAQEQTAEDASDAAKLVLRWGKLVEVERHTAQTVREIFGDIIAAGSRLTRNRKFQRDRS